MIDWQYIFMFVTENRQKNYIAMTHLQGSGTFEVQGLTTKQFLTNIQELSSATFTHHAAAKDFI